MKKLFILFLFAVSAQWAFGQLDVKVREDADQFIVEFPAHQNFEYKISMVDPIINGTVEMQTSQVAASDQVTEVKWHTAAGMNYELAYRYTLSSGELSDWYKMNPNLLLEADH
jgi:hypothetical protein